MSKFCLSYTDQVNHKGVQGRGKGRIADWQLLENQIENAWSNKWVRVRDKKKEKRRNDKTNKVNLSTMKLIKADGEGKERVVLSNNY